MKAWSRLGSGVNLPYLRNMKWEYVAGFFDADGSVTAIAQYKGKNKTLQVSFHNNERFILESIKNFIQKDLGIKGTITRKLAKKASHQDAYELKYVYRSALLVARKMYPFSIHPKKRYRIEVYEEIQFYTIRNGKYTEEQQKHRKMLMDKFFEE